MVYIWSWMINSIFYIILCWVRMSTLHRFKTIIIIIIVIVGKYLFKYFSIAKIIIATKRGVMKTLQYGKSCIYEHLFLGWLVRSCTWTQLLASVPSELGIKILDSYKRHLAIYITVSPVEFSLNSLVQGIIDLGQMTGKILSACGAG